MTEITDPDKIHARAMATAERLHLIADAIAEGVFTNFDIAVREDKRSHLVDKRGRNFEASAPAITVSFVCRESSQKFYEDQISRKKELDEMIAQLSLVQESPDPKLMTFHETSGEADGGISGGRFMAVTLPDEDTIDRQNEQEYISGTGTFAEREDEDTHDV